MHIVLFIRNTLDYDPDKELIREKRYYNIRQYLFTLCSNPTVLVQGVVLFHFWYSVLFLFFLGYDIN